MDEAVLSQIQDILSVIDVPTKDLTIVTVKGLLPKSQKLCKDKTQDCKIWYEVLDKLWMHMQAGLIKFDSQLLCGTCFYTILCNVNEQGYYLKEVLKIINEEVLIRNAINEVNLNTSLAITLIGGLFQSSFLTQKSFKDISIVVAVLEVTFNLLILLAYEYSEYTYTAFKTMCLFKKLLGTELQEIVFNEYNQIILLNLINHNWENHTAGVKDFNKSIFHTLLSVMDASMFKGIVGEINEFCWNKAKYLMIAEVIDYSLNLADLLNDKDWIDGVLYSLFKSGVVSAGADMYYAILKKINFENEWSTLFLSKIINILSRSSTKAIENFTNYWCLKTFEKFPSLLELLIDELKSVGQHEKTLYSILCVMKQGNKLGLIDKNWNLVDVNSQWRNNLIINTIEHCDPYIRMLAFDIICVSTAKVVPSQTEYELILSYLNNNVNSDCTVLRLSMLCSLKSFLHRVHNIFISCTKDCEKENILDFCKRLQDIIIISLQVNGNYQRKITCVKVCSTVLEVFKEIPNKPRFEVGNSQLTLYNILKDGHCGLIFKENFIMVLINLLKDPADDIRVNVVQLLSNHYDTEIRRTGILNNIIQDALTCIRGKFFYQINCGQSMFKLIVSTLMKNTHSETVFKTIEDVFRFGCSELISEYSLKRDIVESIENGRQLHSFISILHVVIEICLQTPYRFKISNDIIFEIISTLEGISKQFSREDISSSSDFSKMSTMVENIISTSNFAFCDVNDKTKISGLHQIVLNCLWLNVKASCDLSSLLIQFHRNDTDVEVCEKCLNIITHILETSRHKGAIEAAGAALGQGIRHLTSLPENSSISKIPYILLKCKLKELISEASRMASVTRRGAGLSIMVHRIVSNDMKKGKPLFRYFMATVLETCSNTEDYPEELNETSDIDNEKDLPKAIYIHFLTRIVTDSSLASDVMYYAAKLAELAFDNLTNSHWQIRNAALQLYGALVPKLIGQKKAAATDDETVATVACDEFRLHLPKLWTYINQQLMSYNDSDTVVHFHSNLMPILNILANIAKRYNFSYDLDKQKDSDRELLKSLVPLLGSPIYAVRRLTAKCICNIYTFEVIYETLLKTDCSSENLLHGCLMLTVNCHKQHSDNKMYKNIFRRLEKKYNEVLIKRKHSYLCRMHFELVFNTEDCLILDNIKNTLMELKSNVYVPGVHIWAELRIKIYIELALWQQIPEVLEIFLDLNNYEQYCVFILTKLEKDDNIAEDILKQIFVMLITSKYKFDSGVIWQILFKISSHIELSNLIDISNILEYLENKRITCNLRYMIPCAARIFVQSKDERGLLCVSKIILSLSNSETTDIDMRHIAAISNNELANVLKELPDVIKIISIKSAVILLQDEDEDIRNLSVNFYTNIYKRQAPHAYICLHKILNRQFLLAVLNEPEISIEVICNDLAILLINTSNKDAEEYNPFANDSKNIYLEIGVLKQLIESLTNI